MQAKKFEQQLDEGVDVTASLDLSKAKRALQEQRRVNVDFPTWMIDSLNREASKLGLQGSLLFKFGWPNVSRRRLLTWRYNGRAQAPRTADLHVRRHCQHLGWLRSYGVREQLGHSAEVIHAP